MADPSILNEKIQNDTMLRALRGESVDHVPVWLMRQAGRYLPEFRKLRESYDFFTMCTTPTLVSETTLQPLERFPIDAVVLFSDILVIPQALGFEVKMEPSVGPVFPNPLPNPDDLQKRVLDIPHESCRAHLQYVYDGIVETRKNLRGRVPLIGFAGAPWTLMCYMIDGSGSEKSKGKFAQAINWLYMHGEAAHKLLDKLAREIAAHLVQQVRYGAHLVQLFDTWAGLIPPHLYDEFGLPYLKLTLDLFRAECPDTPVICFAKGAWFALDKLSKLGFNALSLDWTIDPVWAREQVAGRCGLQGNLDPLCLHASKEKIREQVKMMLHKFNHSSTGLKHYVANLGHGCLPTFDPEHVGAFVDAVHEFSKEIISANSK